MLGRRVNAWHLTCKGSRTEFKYPFLVTLSLGRDGWGEGGPPVTRLGAKMTVSQFGRVAKGPIREA